MLRTIAFVASVFLVFHIPYSTLATSGTNGTPNKNAIFSHCAYAAGVFFACASDTSQPADSTKPAKKKSIWQRIASIFAFRARADKRWSERAKKLIDSMGIMDSITAQHDNIRNLTDSQKIYYNSLLAMVGAIEKKLAADTAIGKGGVAPPDEPSIITTDSSGFSPMTDAIQALADKLSPIIDQQKAAAAEALKKSAALAVLSRANYPGTVFNTKGDTVTQYRYFLKARTGIYGFHNYTYNEKYKGYSFDRITGLIYNGLTIDSKGLIYSNGWDRAKVIRDARDAGTGVYANFLLQAPYRIKAFLQDSSTRSRFIRHLLFLLAPDTATGLSHIQAANAARGKIKGVNIAFDGLPQESRDDFVDFIRQIRSSKGFADSTYQLFVTLPIVDSRKAYDLAGLDPFVDKFIVNFVADALHPPIGNGPVFPLNGGQPNSILTCVSQLSNDGGILPGKMIIGIPYFGARWLVSKTTGAGRFIQYLNYSDIRAKTGWTSATDPATGAAYMDSAAGRGFRDSVYRIWFDDENTLGAKYDFILSSQLGGIAISTLGYDAGYGELWDELSYKLLQLDSVPVSYTITPVIPEAGWLGKITDRMYLYWYILQHPCELCFDNIQDSTTSQKVWLYLNELRLDSVINEKNKSLCDTCKFNSRFQYINNEMANFTGWSTIILLALTIIALLIYLYGIKTYGSQWPQRNLLLIFVRSFFIVWVLFLFTWAFCDKRAGIFNAHRDRNIVATQALGITVTFKRDTPIEASSSKWFESNEAYCDDALLRGKCIDMPLSIFLSILLAGMLAGYLINKFTTTVTENDQVP